MVGPYFAVKGLNSFVISLGKGRNFVNFFATKFPLKKAEILTKFRRNFRCALVVRKILKLSLNPGKRGFVVGTFAEMSEGVSCICDITAHDLARTHVSYYNDDAKRTKGMYRQRIRKAWGHTAHRGWARLLLNRARDLITHDPAHHGANGAAISKGGDDQDGHFFSTTPRGGTLLPKHAQPLLLLFRFTQ